MKEQARAFFVSRGEKRGRIKKTRQASFGVRSSLKEMKRRPDGYFLEIPR